MQTEELECRIRTFLADDMMKDGVRSIPVDAELELDSLDQTELRVFLDEEFGIKAVQLTGADPFVTIGDIVGFIAGCTAAAS